MNESISIVEKIIGRKLVKCWNASGKKQTLKLSTSDYGDVSIWVPSFDVYIEIVISVINHYRKPETFSPKKDLWPYVEPYTDTHRIFGPSFRNLDQKFFNSLLSGQQKTVYDLVSQVLAFSDGVQVLDPFMVLGVAAVERAIDKTKFIPSIDRYFPPGSAIEAELKAEYTDDTGGGIKEYQLRWAAALSQYIEINEAVQAGAVRLVPGRLRVHSILNLVKADGGSFQATVDKVRGLAGTNADEDAVFPYVRALQTVLEAGCFKGASPLFLDDTHMEAASEIMKVAASDVPNLVDPDSLIYSRLASNVGLSASAKPTMKDVITLRRNDDLFGSWTEIRHELVSELQLMSVKDDVSRKDVEKVSSIIQKKWASKLEAEWKKSDALSKKLQLGKSVALGVVVGAATAGVTAATGGTALPILAAAGGSGAIGVAGLPLINWFEARIGRNKKSEARAAFQKHMMSLTGAGAS